MLKTKGSRIKALRKALNLNQEEFASKLDVTQAAISLIEKGDSLSSDLAELISKTYKCDLTWIILGEGEMIQKEDKKGVPVYNVDFTAGDVTLFNDDQTAIIGYVDLEGFRMCEGFARVRGSSMYPEFTAGDFIGLEPDLDITIIEYGMPYGIVTKTNKRLFKIIRKGKDDDHLILRSINKEYDDINIHKDKILKLYKVHGPVRDQWQ